MKPRPPKPTTKLIERLATQLDQTHELTQVGSLRFYKNADEVIGIIHGHVELSGDGNGLRDLTTDEIEAMLEDEG